MVLRRGPDIALIERRRAGRTYYLFPGGGVEAGESPEQAAAREAKEELGLDVVVRGLLARSGPAERPQWYYAADIAGGTLGTGTGPELASAAASEEGSYTARWIRVEDLGSLDVRPRSLAAAIVAGELRGVLECLD